jgi:hypothetical protein
MGNNPHMIAAVTGSLGIAGCDQEEGTEAPHAGALIDADQVEQLKT